MVARQRQATRVGAGCADRTRPPRWQPVRPLTAAAVSRWRPLAFVVCLTALTAAGLLYANRELAHPARVGVPQPQARRDVCRLACLRGLSGLRAATPRRRVLAARLRARAEHRPRLAAPEPVAAARPSAPV